MDAELATKSPNRDESTTREYSLIIDGVIEVKANVDAKSFFDGLLDVVLAYVEKHEGMAGLSISRSRKRVRLVMSSVAEWE